MTWTMPVQPFYLFFIAVDYPYAGRFIYSLLGIPRLDTFLHDPNRLVEPLGIATKSLQLHLGIPLPGILRRSAQWLDMTRSHQQGEKIRRPTEITRGVFGA